MNPKTSVVNESIIKTLLDQSPAFPAVVGFKTKVFTAFVGFWSVTWQIWQIPSYPSSKQEENQKKKKKKLLSFLITIESLSGCSGTWTPAPWRAYCVSWMGNGTKQDYLAFRRVVRSAEWTIRTTLPNLRNIYTKRCPSRATKILNQPSHRDILGLCHQVDISAA